MWRYINLPKPEVLQVRIELMWVFHSVCDITAFIVFSVGLTIIKFTFKVILECSS